MAGAPQLFVEALTCWVPSPSVVSSSVRFSSNSQPNPGCGGHLRCLSRPLVPLSPALGLHRPAEHTCIACLCTCLWALAQCCLLQVSRDSRSPHVSLILSYSAPRHWDFLPGLFQIILLVWWGFKLLVSLLSWSLLVFQYLVLISQGLWVFIPL